GKFLVIEFQDFGVTRGIANNFRREIRLAEIDVEDADGEIRKRREEGANCGARDGIALSERTETDGVRGTGQRNPVLGELHEIPSNAFGDVIFGLAFAVDVY